MLEVPSSTPPQFLYVFLIPNKICYFFFYNNTTIPHRVGRVDIICFYSKSARTFVMKQEPPPTPQRRSFPSRSAPCRRRPASRTSANEAMFTGRPPATTHRFILEHRPVGACRARRFGDFQTVPGVLGTVVLREEHARVHVSLQTTRFVGLHRFSIFRSSLNRSCSIRNFCRAIAVCSIATFEIVDM